MSLPSEIAAFLDTWRVGVLGTVGENGRPRQSVVYYARSGERLLVSTEGDRRKARDVERTGWASLAVHGDQPPFPSVTVAGPAQILRDDIGPLTAQVVQRITGADVPPEPQTDEALAAVDRVILELGIERIGPVSYVERED